MVWAPHTCYHLSQYNLLCSFQSISRGLLQVPSPRMSQLWQGEGPSYLWPLPCRKRCQMIPVSYHTSLVSAGHSRPNIWIDLVNGMMCKYYSIYTSISLVWLCPELENPQLLLAFPRDSFKNCSYDICCQQPRFPFGSSEAHRFSRNLTP